MDLLLLLLLLLTNQSNQCKGGRPLHTAKIARISSCEYCMIPCAALFSNLIQQQHMGHEYFISCFKIVAV
jgi:hypothetical protein